jgi:peptide/nickel transport system permease protein
MIRRAWRDPAGRLGLLLIVTMVFLIMLAPLRDGPDRLDIIGRFAAPSLLHPAGTDQLGRDVLSRLGAGGAVALGVAVLTILLAAAAGTLLGVLAARVPGWADRTMLVLFDVIAAFPTLIFALAAVALFGPGTGKLIVLIAITLIPHFGRVARAQTLTLNRAPFLEAARAIGAGPFTMLRHIVPNISGPLLVLACMDIPSVIAVQAGLSFLGVGVPPPAPSWGGLLFDGYVHLDQSPWPCLFVCLALILATLGFTLTGEALRDPGPGRARSMRSER